MQRSLSRRRVAAVVASVCDAARALAFAASSSGSVPGPRPGCSAYNGNDERRYVVSSLRCSLRRMLHALLRLLAHVQVMHAPGGEDGEARGAVVTCSNGKSDVNGGHEVGEGEVVDDFSGCGMGQGELLSAGGQARVLTERLPPLPDPPDPASLHTCTDTTPGTLSSVRCGDCGAVFSLTGKVGGGGLVPPLSSALCPRCLALLRLPPHAANASSKAGSARACVGVRPTVSMATLTDAVVLKETMKSSPDFGLPLPPTSEGPTVASVAADSAAAAAASCFERSAIAWIKELAGEYATIN